MRREFIINLLILLGANLLIKPIYIFGIDRTVQNVVGPEEYGVYFALFNFTLLFQIISDIGLQNYNNRTISQSPNLIHSYFPSILIVKTILALLFIGIIYLVGVGIGYQERFLDLLIWLGANAVLVSLILYLRTNISGTGRYRFDSLLSILDKLLMIIIIGYLLYTDGAFDIETFIYGQTSALLISAGIIGIIAWRIARPLTWPTSFESVADILKRSWPYAAVVLLMTIYTRVDAVMIERLLSDGEYETGVYASGYRFFDAANMIGFLAAGLLLPIFSKMLALKDSPFPLYRLSFKVMWLVAIFISTVCFINRQELVDLLYTNANPYWASVLGCLMLSFVFVMIGYITGPLLTANGSISQLNWIFVFSIVLNIGLNALLIPTYKAYGAAIATLFTQGFVMLAQLGFVHRIFDFSLIRYPIKAMMFGGFLVTISLIVARNWTSSQVANLIGIIFIGSLLSIYLFLYIRKEIASERIDISKE